MSGLKACQVYYQQHAHFILKDIHFEARPGEIVCLLGSNGSGKSSLLKSCAGLVPGCAGTLTLAGEQIAQMSDKTRARLIGWLPQQLNRPFGMTVSDFFSLDADLSGDGGSVPCRQDANGESLASLLALFELSHLKNAEISRLSGGEWKRCQLAWLWQSRFQLMLLDEPDSELDLRHKKKLVRFCRDYVQKNSSVLLIATHDIDFAREISTHIFALSEGRLVWASKADEFWKTKVINKIFSTKVF